MNKEIAMKWAEALESGKYKQGMYSLKTSSNYFCCLGVLCDISGLGKWDDTNAFRTDNESASKVLPKNVKNWAGMSFKNGDYKGQSGFFCSLSRYNDGNPQTTFTEIASFIRKYWKAL